MDNYNACENSNCKNFFYYENGNYYEFFTDKNGKVKEGVYFCNKCHKKNKPSLIPCYANLIIKSENKVVNVADYCKEIPQDVANIIADYLRFDYHYIPNLDQDQYNKIQKIMYRSLKCSAIEVISDGRLQNDLGLNLKYIKELKQKIKDLNNLVKTAEQNSGDEDDDSKDDVKDDDNTSEVKSDEDDDDEEEDDQDASTDDTDDDDDYDDGVEEDLKSNANYNHDDEEYIDSNYGPSLKFRINQAVEDLWNDFYLHMLDYKITEMLPVKRFEKELINYLQSNNADGDCFQAKTQVVFKRATLVKKIDKMEKRIIELKQELYEIEQQDDYKYASWIPKSKLKPKLKPRPKSKSKSTSTSTSPKRKITNYNNNNNISDNNKFDKTETKKLKTK